MVILIKFLLAHFLADFVFQPTRWVQEKEKYTIKSRYYYFHVILHLGLLFLLTWDVSFWKGILIISFSHAVIDFFKLKFQKEENKRRWFFIDQALHLFIIFLVWYFIVGIQILEIFPLDINFLLVLTATIFLISPSAIIIKYLLAPWEPVDSSVNYGSRNAGRYIGIAERLLILIFILVNQWQAIGFLLAAKSVFRFKDIQKDTEFKTTEYILLGTMISFAFGIATGLAVNHFLSS